MDTDAFKKQRKKFMAYNLVAFTLIFTLFGLIVYAQMRSSLFSPVDEDLQRARTSILSASEFVDEQLNWRNRWTGGQEGRSVAPDYLLPQQTYVVRMPRIPMKIQVVLRDSNGQIVNPQLLGRIYWEGLSERIPFSANELQTITSFHIDDGGFYRGLSFAANSASGGYYIQLIANVDGEQSIIENFTRILVLCVALFIILSITASYFLAQKSMTPLVLAWNRQTEFVENASHELRTPLTIIQNKLESLLTTPQATIIDKADSIVMSLSETRRLSGLTSDLMTLARADSNQTQIQKENFELDELISKVSEPYAELAEANEKSLRLSLLFGDAILADKSRIHEMMVILLDNALKYTREGDEIIIATCERDNKVILQVIDTGIGIGEENRARIFERFYREDKARSRENGGMGLGLSIAKWIVDIHGGSIKAIPNQPKGTIIEIKLSK